MNAKETGDEDSGLPPTERPSRTRDQAIVAVPETFVFDSRTPRTGESTLATQSGIPTIRKGGETELIRNRYRLEAEIARGGMGVVWRARDIEIGRDLAIKSLLSGFDIQSTASARFVAEAQISGQLQHPGIAPVYEMGQLADGRPFFSMKLVEGKTLSALLKERPSPDGDRQKFLGIFHQVCQAVAYAHCRGVIHRDLKPSNVMVGKFGEVQVMDWGLAKVLSRETGDASAGDETSPQEPKWVQTLRTGDSAGGSGSAGSQTTYGSVLGTPAYMPPEQAVGDVERLDERADVFGLGAILVEILTGKPPYVGHSSVEIRQRAARGDTGDCLEVVNSLAIDRPLKAICHRSLEVDPKNRYSNAGDLADALGAYFDDVQSRLRQAEMQQAAERARTEEAMATAASERRRKRWTIAFVIAASLAFTLLAGGAMVLERQRSVVLSAKAESMIAKSQVEQKKREEISNKTSAAYNALSRATNILDDRQADEPPTIAELKTANESLENAGHIIGDTASTQAIADIIRQSQDRLRVMSDDLTLFAKLENLWTDEVENNAFKLLDGTPVLKPGEIHAPKSGFVNGFRAALREHGIDPDSASPKQASQWILQRHRWLRERLLAAMIYSATPAASQSDTDVKPVDEATWMNAIIQELIHDPWQLDLYNALRKHDCDVLLKLAESETLANQPDDFVFLLAEGLQSLSRRCIIDQCDQAGNWTLAEPVHISTTSKRKTAIQDDGSILIDGGQASTDQITITFPADASQLHGIRIETIQDSRLPQNGPGFGRGRLNLLLSKITIHSNNDPKFETLGGFLRNDGIFTNHDIGPINGPGKAIDTDIKTSWFLIHYPSQTIGTAIVFFKPQPRPSPHVSVCISSGNRDFGNNATLGRFRLSYTYEKLDPIDPQYVAESLLETLFARKPSNYRLALAMAKLLGSPTSPEMSEATRFATMAASLRPNSESAQRVLLKFLLSDDPPVGSRAFRLAEQTAKRIELSTGSRVGFGWIAISQARLGNRLFDKEKSNSIEALQKAMELEPNANFYWKIGYQLAQLNRVSDAVMWYQRGVEKRSSDPLVYTGYTRLLFSNRYHDAAVKWEELLRMTSENVIASRAIAMECIREDRLVDGLRCAQRAITLAGGTREVAVFSNAVYQTTDPVALREACRELLLADPQSEWFRELLLYAICRSTDGDAKELARSIESEAFLQALPDGFVDAQVSRYLFDSARNIDSFGVALRLAKAGCILSPDVPRTFETLAIAHLMDDANDKSLDAAKQAMEVSSRMGISPNGVAELLCAVSAQRLGKSEEAESWFRQHESLAVDSESLLPLDVERAEFLRELFLR